MNNLRKTKFSHSKKDRKVRNLVIIGELCALSLLGKSGWRGTTPMAEMACSMPPHHHLSPSAQEVPIMPASKGGERMTLQCWVSLDLAGQLEESFTPCWSGFIMLFFKAGIERFREPGTFLPDHCFLEDKTRAFKWGFRRGFYGYLVKTTLRAGKKEKWS